jgi:hypothetical protein
MEEGMKHLFHFFCPILLLASINCFADSVRTLNNLSVSLEVFPNDGFGDNIRGTITGAGVNLNMGGGTPADWYNNDVGFAPGSIGGGDTTIFLDLAFGTILSKSYDSCCNLTFGNTPAFDAGSFTFPTNGQGFTVTVPGSIEVMVFVSCPDSGGCKTFNLVTRPGTLTLSFAYSPDTGLYYGTGGSFASTVTPVPEPATIALLALGVGTMPWRKYKKILAERVTGSKS